MHSTRAQWDQGGDGPVGPASDEALRALVLLFARSLSGRIPVLRGEGSTVVRSLVRSMATFGMVLVSVNLADPPKPARQSLPGDFGLFGGGKYPQ